jgi:hypothetical protein
MEYLAFNPFHFLESKGSLPTNNLIRKKEREKKRGHRGL